MLGLLFAQVPQAFYCQAVARNANGQSVVSQNISIKTSIRENTEGREKEFEGLSQLRSVGFLAQDAEQLIKETKFTAFDALLESTRWVDYYGLA